MLSRQSLGGGNNSDNNGSGGNNSANNITGLPKSTGPLGLGSKIPFGPPRPPSSGGVTGHHALPRIPPPPSPQLTPHPTPPNPPNNSPFGGLFGSPPNLQVSLLKLFLKNNSVLTAFDTFLVVNLINL